MIVHRVSLQTILYCNVVWKSYPMQVNICLFHFLVVTIILQKMTWVETNSRPQMWDQWGHTIWTAECDDTVSCFHNENLNGCLWLRQCKVYKNAAKSTNSVPRRKADRQLRNITPSFTSVTCFSWGNAYFFYDKCSLFF